MKKEDSPMMSYHKSLMSLLDSITCRMIETQERVIDLEAVVLEITRMQKLPPEPFVKILDKSQKKRLRLRQKLGLKK